MTRRVKLRATLRARLCSATYPVIMDVDPHARGLKEESLKAPLGKEAPTKVGPIVRIDKLMRLCLQTALLLRPKLGLLRKTSRLLSSPCIPHPSARANGAERTKANSDAVIVFIVFTDCCI